MYEIAIEVLSRITSFGYLAFLVGGYPRNLYLQLEVSDVDICTSASFEELKKMWGSSLKEKKYGSFLLCYKGVSFEITTFRKESGYQKNRFPTKVEYTQDLFVDLKRRDFIINTLCIDVNGNFIDLLNAREDLENRIIRVVGDPEKKLKEDALRMLRAIRFATVLNFNLDPIIIEVIRENSHLVKNLSYFRKKKELDKIFSSAYVEYGLKLIKTCGLFDALEISNAENIVVTQNPIGVYSQLSMSPFYPFSKKERRKMTRIQQLLKMEHLTPCLLYQYGLSVCLVIADIKKIDQNVVIKEYMDLPIHKRKDLSISAEEICTIYNKEVGPYLKEVFSLLEKKILTGQLKNEKEEIKEFLKHTL